MNARNAIACTLIAALAGSAPAQPRSIYASGLEHSALGGAVLGPAQDRRVPAHNLGSSGEDGAEVKLDSVFGGSVTLDAGPLLATAGSEIKIRRKGWDGQIHGIHRIISNGDGTGHMNFDFTDQGALSIDVMEVDEHGVVISNEHHEGGSVDQVWVPNLYCADGSLAIVCWRWVKICPTCEPVLWVGWACSDGGEFTSGDPHGFVVQPNFPIGTPDDGATASFLVTARGLPEIEILAGALTTFGVESWGLGEAHIVEECSNPTDCSQAYRKVRGGIGASGNDGVAVAVNQNAQSTQFAQRRSKDGWDLKENTKFYDDQARVMLDVTHGADPLMGQTQLLMDMHGVGADQFQATFLSPSGEVLATTIYSTSGPGGNSPAGPVLNGDCGSFPRKWEWDSISRTWVFTGCDTGWMCSTTPGAPPFGPVTSIQLSPIGGDVSRLARMEARGSDIAGDIIIDSVTQTAFCPSDFDHTGFVDFEDYGAFVAAFEAGTQDADFDHSGFVDIEDFVAFVHAFEEGC